MLWLAVHLRPAHRGAPVGGSVASELTIDVGPGVPPGTYQVEVAGSRYGSSRLSYVGVDVAVDGLIFKDGFESGNVLVWH